MAIKSNIRETVTDKLHITIEQFKAWADQHFPAYNEEHDNGEWELGSDEFEAMRDAALMVIRTIVPEETSPEVIDELLYVIARDNESMIVIQELSPDWYNILCKAVLKTSYTNAKWQFAEHLKYHIDDEEIKPLIFDFLKSGDEYTERMALASLSVVYPDKAEEYAELFWNRKIYDADEYQKIMALHVLYSIGSTKLEHYLQLADHSSYAYLRRNAQDIRRKINDDRKRFQE